MNKRNKQFIFDLETTGLDPKKNGIIQIAGIIKIDNKVMHRFDIRCNVFPNQVLDPRALQINRVTPEQIATYKDPQVAFKALIAVLSQYVDRYNSRDKFTVMGYNCAFDTSFMREFFINNKDKYYGSWFNSYDVIDVHKLFTGLRGTGLYPELEALPNMKLETLAKYYNIDITAHDALSDIHATEELFKIFTLQLGTNDDV